MTFLPCFTSFPGEMRVKLVFDYTYTKIAPNIEAERAAYFVQSVRRTGVSTMTVVPVVAHVMLMMTVVTTKMFWMS